MFHQQYFAFYERNGVSVTDYAKVDDAPVSVYAELLLLLEVR